MKYDWKFGLTLLIGFAGVAVPVWLWQADQASKSLSVRMATRISLQPKEQDSLVGIEISADGSRLEKPHLVVFEIRNNGNKPILAADFESPVRIHLISESSIARASISSKTPKDIEATLLTERQAISLKPTLLNPGDSISINAITSGALPLFEASARIVGITSVLLEDSTNAKPNRLKQALLLFGATLSLIGFSLMSDVISKPDGVFLRRRAAAFVGIVTAFPGVIALQAFLEEIGIQGYGYFLLWYMLLMIPVGFLASVLNRSPKVQSTDAGGK